MNNKDIKQRKFFKQKLGDQIIIIGLSSLAVLATIAEAVGRTALSFPDRGTSLRKILRDLENRNIRGFEEYLSILKEISGYNLSVILHRLETKGLIRKIAKEYRPTNKGNLFLKKIHNTSNKNQIEWDGKWRLITFDIPEKLRQERNWLRHSLQAAHYKMLHKSVFVGKFPLDEETYKSIYHKKLDRYVRILTVGEIDEDDFD